MFMLKFVLFSKFVISDIFNPMIPSDHKMFVFLKTLRQIVSNGVRFLTCV